jgi:hypothetical protein
LGPNPIVYSVAVDPNDSSQVYAVTPDGVFRLTGAPPAPRSSTADQARAFAEPILADIADRPPDYEDDFSDPGSGWPGGSTPGADEWGYAEDEYFNSGIYFLQDECCTGAGSETMPLLSDFVLELDARFVPSAQGQWGVVFRDLGDHYAVGFWPDGRFRVWKNVDGIHTELKETDVPAASFKPGYEANHLTIIAQGPQIAFYVNGEPVWLIYDESVSRGRFQLLLENAETDAPLRVHFDNLNVWDISDLTLTPSSMSPIAEQAHAFAEPILAAIADRAPDLEDDFSDPASGWERGILVDQTGWEEGERGYVDGEYYIVAPAAKPRPQHTDTPITCASGFLIDHRSLSDMVLEVEGRFVAVEDGNWHINLRQWHDPNTDVGGKHEVMAFPDGTVQISSVASDQGPVLMAQLQGPPMRPGLETNRLQIVTVGPQIALYVNGEPALFATDRYFDERYERGEFSLVVCNEADTPLEARWDNLRIWDISDLSLPSAEAAVPTPAPMTSSVKVDMWSDVWCWLQGPAGDLASRNPHTGLDVVVQVRDAVRDVAQIVVESPDGEIVVLPPYGDIPYGEEGRFSRLIQGLPQTWGTYTFTALDADGTPIPGAVTSDVYVGGYEPDPVTNVLAEVVEAGILVNWDPSPVISGAFEPNGSPPFGFYSIYFLREEGEILYAWSHGDSPLSETSHLIPFRRQDFGQGDAGLALEEIDDGVYYLELHTFSVEPEWRAGQHAECIAHNPAENIQIVIEGGQVRVEKR